MHKTKRVCLRRTRILFVFITFSYFLVALKLFSIQVLQSSYWKALAKSQHLGTEVLKAERGSIFSSDNFLLVGNTFYYDVFVDPTLLPSDFKDKLRAVRNILYPLEKDKEFAPSWELWLSRLNNKNSRYFVLQKNVPLEKKNKIESLNYEWIGFTPQLKRDYSNNQIYSHILGFVGKDASGNDKGYFGIEGYYDGDLRGVDGFIEQEVSAGGSPFLLGNYNQVKSLNGSSLELTIDRTLQAIAFNEVKKGVERYGADSGLAIIVNSTTGEILAMSNYPTYDPLKYSEYYKENEDIFINKAISSTYEPGSVIKPLTMSSAIDLGLVTPETTMNDAGPVSYSGHLIDNWDKKHHGIITMSDILALSNNIGAAWVGSKVGSKKLYEYFNKFGFNRKLGVDLEGEETGFLRNYNQWRDIDLATASFGQGISATPLQVVMAFSAIANNGVLMKPYIVKKIINEKETLYKKPVVLGRVLKPTTASTMVGMLTTAVARGEAKFFVTKKYNVAGKTGTAQISEKGKYLEDATNATFVGFLPKYKNFVMLVKLERPKASVFASETAVPVWMNILEKATAYLGLPPDK